MHQGADDPEVDCIEVLAKAHERAAAAATQSDDAECVCGHPRSDHGDGVVHTACCGLIKVPLPSGDHDAPCECEEFEAA